jgi:hypothetical protein
MKMIFALPFLAAGSLAVSLHAQKIPQFEEVEIDADIQIGYGLAIADVDGDGKPDILLADKRQIVWYKNPGWEKFVMAERLTQLDHVCIAAADITGDGKAEVAVGAGWNPGDTITSGSVHFLIPPTDRRERWEPVRLQHEPTTHRMRWVRNLEGRFDLVVVPLHGPGNKGGRGDGVRILAYKKPDDPRDPWLTELIDSALHLTHNFDPVHWTHHSAEDLLVAGREGVFLFSRGPEKWEGRQLAGNEPGEEAFIGAGEVRAGRLPGGERFIATIEPMHGNQVVIYTAPSPSDQRQFWKRNVLDESLVDGHALACGDFLGVGSDQLLAGWRAMNRPGAKVGVRLYIPLDEQGKDWKPVLIDDNTMACEDLAIADLDGDGKLDFVAAGRATRNVKIYFNRRAN